jgi:hypothetical protein
VAELHLIATVFMAGVIVFVQVVHYPLMGSVASSDFVHYQQGHTDRTGWVVAPPMLAELATAVWLAAEPPVPELKGAAYSGLALLGVVWLSTVVLQVPAHRILAGGFDPTVHRRLVSTNWIRTIAWVARVPIALTLMKA